MAVQFKKNEKKSLNDLGGTSPILVFAIGWGSKEKDGLLNKMMGKTTEVDLDLSCVVYDNNNDRIDCVWYAQLNSKDNAIRHKGDDTVGWDEGDDEAIIVDLNQIDEQAKNLFFVISSFTEEKFSEIDDAYWRLFDGQNKREIARFDLSPRDKSSAKIVMQLEKVEKDGIPDWQVKALDEKATGKNVQEVFYEIRTLIDQGE